MKGICYMTATPIVAGYDHNDIAIPSAYIESLKGFDGKAFKSEIDAARILAPDGFIQEMTVHAIQSTEDESLDDPQLHVIFMLSQEVLDQFEGKEVNAVCEALAEKLIEPFGGEITVTEQGPLGPVVRVDNFDRDLYFRSFEGSAIDGEGQTDGQQ